MDTELLEDVEPSFLVSLSDSQVSCRDISSDCRSSDTLESSISSMSKARGRVWYPEHECLFEEIPSPANYENDHILKLTKNSFDTVFRSQSLEINNRNTKSFKSSFFKESKTNSVSLSNLSMYDIDCTFGISKMHSSINGCIRNDLSQSKRCVSLPNLTFIPKHKMIYSLRKVLQNIPDSYNNSEDSFLKLALHCAKAYSFGDYLIKILLEKVHSIQFSVIEKDILISELMHGYNKLILKYAEAENKIDRMRFDDPMSEELSSVSILSLNPYEQSLINPNSVVIPQETETNFPNTGLHKRHKDLEDRNDTIPTVNAQRRMRKLESCINKHNYNQKEFMCGEIGLDVKTSEGEIVNSLADNDNVLLGDPDFYLCEVDNKINLDKLEKDILLHECTTHHKNGVSSDNDSSSQSDDELSLRGPRNQDILRTANSLHSEKTLKNNFNNSYNKIISYAKAKRKLASYPEFYDLIYERNGNVSYESLPNLDIQNLEETIIKSTEESNKPTENKNIEVNDAQRLTIENVDLSDHNSECITMENISVFHPKLSSDNDDSHLTENSQLSEQPSSLLNNVLVQEKNAYKKEDKVMPKYLYSRNPDSNFKTSVYDLKETNQIHNRIQMDVKYSSGGNFYDTFPQYKEQHIFTKIGEPPEDESESSASLGSVKLEACECWNEPMLPSSQTIRSWKQEILPLENKIVISPLHLDLSSSDDYSLPIFGRDSQENDETRRSFDYAVIGEEKIKGLNQLQMKAKSGGVPLRDTSRKTAEGMQSLVPADYSQKKIYQIMNSLNKIDTAASELKRKTEGLKNYLSLQLDSIS